jgi:hypothetical protein
VCQDKGSDALDTNLQTPGTDRRGSRQGDLLRDFQAVEVPRAVRAVGAKFSSQTSPYPAYDILAKGEEEISSKFPDNFRVPVLAGDLHEAPQNQV